MESRNEVSKPEEFDVAVVGAGPAGLAAACLLARSGLNTAHFVGPQEGSQPRDPRTTALMLGAIRLLEHLQVWQDLRHACAPLKRLRLIDDTDWTVKAPTVTFDSAELGEEAFGWNVPNQDLVSALEDLAASLGEVASYREAAARVETSAHSVNVTGSAGNRVSARLVVAADGRQSLCREAARIRCNEWSYPQSAVACSFAHEKPHENTSIEFHKPAGPFTLVPLPGNRSSLVWVTEPGIAEELRDLSDDQFCERLSEEARDTLGALSSPGPRGVFPIKGLTARRFAADRVVLVGEAGHVLPPIGAQGLNLGLRDAALIAELAQDAASHNRDIAGRDVLEEYDRRRRLDILPRTALVDFLNRSLFSGTMPLQGLRGLGLFMLDTVGPLRRAVMRQGMEPQSNLPLLMQREPEQSLADRPPADASS